MHHTLCDFILDIVQNSFEAGSRTVELEIEQDEARIGVRVTDDGRGMAPAELERAIDPFHTDGTKHRNRRVGLGLPFLRQAVELAGGTFGLRSARGEGTSVEFAFPLDHIDTPPVGDLPGMMLQALTSEGARELVVMRRLRRGTREAGYTVRRSELAEALGTLEDSGALALLGRFLESQENETAGSVQEGSGT
mgnify:CR=1 FL=1|jgi:hypothetical protein